MTRVPIDVGWHMLMDTSMRRETFTGSKQMRPRCDVRPPVGGERYVSYGWCAGIAYWRRGEQRLCDFHAGVAKALDWVDSGVRPAWPLLGWQADLLSLTKWLADYQHFMRWRTRMLNNQLPGINLDGNWPTRQKETA